MTLLNSNANAYKKFGHASEKCCYKCITCNKSNDMDEECWYKKKNEANFSKDETEDQMLYTCLNGKTKSNDI